MRNITDFLKTAFEFATGRSTNIIPPHIDLGYLRRINPDGSMGGIVHSQSEIAPTAKTHPSSVIGPFVKIMPHANIPSGIIISNQNGEIIRSHFPPP